MSDPAIADAQDRAELTPGLLAHSVRAESILAQSIPPADQPPTQLHQAMRYAVLGGGKRLRPMLVYATGLGLGARPEQLDNAAAAVEIIHAYSLVHDDLPAMDDDALRRGQPTCHVVFGEAMAILAGDALQALAFELLAGDQTGHMHPRIQLAMLRVLSVACGSHGMAGGQALDLAAVGTQLDASELERMHMHKTGALIRASVELGALAAGCEDPAQLSALRDYAHCVGLAFQIRDDILDVEGDAMVIGKTAGKDAANDKPTYPAIHGLAHSRRLLSELTETALGHLRHIALEKSELAVLARFVALRNS